jgi:imidazolonepropionase-like amidohydrolase
MNARLEGRFGRPGAAVLLLLVAAGAATARTGEPVHGERPLQLLIRDIRVIQGNGNPAEGPTDVLITGNRIEKIGDLEDEVGSAAVIDGRGRTLIPGLINMHGHLQESRAGREMPLEYQTSLWLASGITTIRDVGSDFERSLEIRAGSAAGTVVAPRVFLYPFLGPQSSPEEMRARIREFHDRGADGIKLYSLDRDQLEAAVDEARSLGLPTTIHMGVEETDALDVARLEMTSLEHWYGVPDAALDGVQEFPPEFSYSNEVDRFRWAGRLWREVVPEKLDQVLDALVAAQVAWDPTFAIYEASRDAVRARNKPWFRDYLHPALEEFFAPSLESHGSYFIGWTNTDEVYWKENYRIWMDAVREFERRGGVVCTGEDAGFIYVMYGFGLIRELELHEEAGFHPLEVLRHATANGARVLGRGDELGQVREGYLADLAVVNGNPLADLRVLYPTGTDVYRDGRPVHAGAIEWTIKDGIPYHGPTLMERVRSIVAEARREAAGGGAGG